MIFLPDNLVIETSIVDDNTILLLDVDDNSEVLLTIEDDNVVALDIVEGIGTDVLPAYEGPYIITPKKVDQQFTTDNKCMTEDVTVLSIPYTEVTNPSGGLTATIGFE